MGFRKKINIGKKVWRQTEPPLMEGENPPGLPQLEGAKEPSPVQSHGQTGPTLTLTAVHLWKPSTYKTGAGLSPGTQRSGFRALQISAAIHNKNPGSRLELPTTLKASKQDLLQLTKKGQGVLCGIYSSVPAVFILRLTFLMFTFSTFFKAYMSPSSGIMLEHT